MQDAANEFLRGFGAAVYWIWETNRASSRGWRAYGAFPNCVQRYLFGGETELDKVDA